jgi:hypothetical protein
MGACDVPHSSYVAAGVSPEVPLFRSRSALTRWVSPESRYSCLGSEPARQVESRPLTSRIVELHWSSFATLTADGVGASVTPKPVSCDRISS